MDFSNDSNLTLHQRLCVENHGFAALQLAFFPFIAVAEIEENCNMQLQALQGNSGNDAVGLDGYTVTQSTDCSDDGRQFNNLETCAANCGCGFQYLEYGSSGSSFIDCRCCQFPLNTFGGPSLLYTKNSCFTTTPAPTTSAPTGIVVGDPHIQTLDGVRYTLLKQGTFSLMALLRVSNARPFLQGNHAGLPCGLASLCSLFRGQVFHQSFVVGGQDWWLASPSTGIDF